MKLKRLISLILAFTFILSCAFLNAYSTNENTVEVIFSNGEITIYAESGMSEDDKDAIIAYFTGAPLAAAETRNVLCDLLGHKISTEEIEVVNHKVRTAAPRCLSSTYDHESCSRCDYGYNVFVSSRYINCCS